jgi:hypothetical protein
MSAVELRLNPRDLSREMGAMRVWLDQNRCETSSFSCRDADNGVLVSLEFKNAVHAHAFAERFGGQAGLSGRPSELSMIGLGVAPSGVVG